MRLLVAAASRSGTLYMTHFLKELGLLAGHENHVIKSPKKSPTCCLTGYTFIFEDPSLYAHIFHQVREPIKAISSITTHPFGVFVRVEEHFKLPTMESCCDRCKDQHPKDGCRMWWGKDFVCENQIKRAARYWLYLNDQAEKIAEWRYKIEDLDTPSVFKEFCERLELGEKEYPKLVIPNSRKENYIPLSYDDISAVDKYLGEKIKEKAEKYGYKNTSRQLKLL